MDKKDIKQKEVSPFERMSEDITKIREALSSLQKIGITKELMEIYARVSEKAHDFSRWMKAN
jgi:hypothetical protein